GWCHQHRPELRARGHGRERVPAMSLIHMAIISNAVRSARRRRESQATPRIPVRRGDGGREELKRKETMEEVREVLRRVTYGAIIKAADETHARVSFTAFSPHFVEKHIPTSSAQRILLPALVSTIEQRRSGISYGSGLVKALSLLPQTKSLVYVISDFLNLTD